MAKTLQALERQAADEEFGRLFGAWMWDFWAIFVGGMYSAWYRNFSRSELENHHVWSVSIGKSLFDVIEKVKSLWESLLKKLWHLQIPHFSDRWFSQLTGPH